MDNMAVLRRALRLANPGIAIDGVYWDCVNREWVHLPVEKRPLLEFSPVISESARQRDNGEVAVWYTA